MLRYLVSLLLVLASFATLAWDEFGYDGETRIEIEKGNVIRPGRQIELYDYNTGTYRDVEVESTRKFGSSTEIEVYDYGTGEYRTIELEH